MKHAVELFFRIALLAFTLFVWLWGLNQPISHTNRIAGAGVPHGSNGNRWSQLSESGKDHRFITESVISIFS